MQRLLCAANLLGAALGSPVDISPAQRRFLADAQTAAAKASQVAEGTLLATFRSPIFRLKLLAEGAPRALAFSPADEILAKLKAALASLEFVFTFGLDPASLRAHPGQPAWDLKVVEKFGHIPTMWELKASASPLAEHVPEQQWRLVDAEETGLYRLPEFAHPAHPSISEALGRPTYASGDLRRVDVGIWRYGVYSPVFRQDVLRERAVLVGVDGGGWETICNRSAASVNTWARLFRPLMHCGAVFSGGRAGSTVFGTADHMLHSLLANTRIFGYWGGSLARVVYQLLAPGARQRPVENAMYIEGGVFGPVRVNDTKLWVGSFPDLFGTDQGEELRAFCRRHGVPLAWGLAGGHMRAAESAHPLHWVPLEPFETWEAGHDRLLDPSSSGALSGISSSSDSSGVWEKVEAEAREARAASAGPDGPGRRAFQAWWRELAATGAAVRPLRGLECSAAGPDLCFGTSAATGECLCGKSSSEAVLV